jgi:hypothetical protein
MIEQHLWDLSGFSGTGWSLQNQAAILCKSRDDFILDVEYR